MSRVTAPVRDIGPEFARKFAHEMHRIARMADRFDRADLIQGECDRLAALSDEDATHARR